jgi:hypothetical protein
MYGFQEDMENRALGQFGRQQVPFIGLKDLITCKKIANRSQDRADLQVLLEVLERTDE